jgi:hypothetical protein
LYVNLFKVWFVLVDMLSLNDIAKVGKMMEQCGEGGSRYDRFSALGESERSDGDRVYESVRVSVVANSDGTVDVSYG